MPNSRPTIRSSSPRAEQIIEAWNRKDIAFVIDQFNENVKLEARSPKIPHPLPNLDIQTRPQLAAALEAYRTLHSRFTIISASENTECILLTLEDAEGDVLILMLELDDNSKIKGIVSYRSDVNTAR